MFAGEAHRFSTPGSLMLRNARELFGLSQIRMRKMSRAAPSSGRASRQFSPAAPSGAFKVAHGRQQCRSFLGGVGRLSALKSATAGDEVDNDQVSQLWFSRGPEATPHRSEGPA